METILSLRPNVTREDAVRQFQGHGVSGRVRSLINGPLQSLAETYVPFHLFRVEVRNGEHPAQVLWLAVDAVTGALDPYSFDVELPQDQMVRVRTRNRTQPRLSVEQARALVLDKARRIVFGNGFFRLRSLNLQADIVPVEFHVPYWIGFFGRDGNAGLVVMDAVRRRIEGAKGRAFFRDWLREAA